MTDSCACQDCAAMRRAEHPIAERDVLGTSQAVPQIMLWQLTYAAMAGDVCTEAGILAEGGV